MAEPVASASEVSAAGAVMPLSSAPAVHCSSCGESNRTGVTFCESCGERLDAALAPLVAPPQPTPPSRPRHALAWGLSAAGLAAVAVVGVVWFTGGDDQPSTVTTGAQAATTTPAPGTTMSTTVTSTSTGASSSTTFTIPPDTNTAGPSGVEIGVVTPMEEVHATTTVPYGVGGGPGSVFGDSPASYNHCWTGSLHEESQAGARGMLDRFGTGSYAGVFYAERCPSQRWDFYGYAGETVRLTLNPSNETPSLQVFQSWWGEEGPLDSDQPLVTDGGARVSSVRLMLPEEGWYVVVVGPFNDPATTYRLRIERSGAPFRPDSDRDGFSDGFEAGLAEFFKPLYQFDDREEGFQIPGVTYPPCVDPRQQALLYQVSPISGPGNYTFGGPGGFVADGWLPGERRYAAITYVLTLERDCGAFAEEAWATPSFDPLPDDTTLVGFSHAHPGDLEVLRFLVEQENPPTGSWSPLGVIFSRHGNPPEWEYWRWLEIKDGSHPLVWVSWSKHATYPSYKKCEDYYPETDLGILLYFAQFEFCGGGDQVYFDLGTADGWNHNVGERFAWTFDFLRDSGSPLLQDVAGYHNWSDPIVDLGGEQAWGGQYFCGGIDPPWSPTGEECKDGLYTKWWPWTEKAFEFVWLMVVEGGIVEVG